MVGELSNSHSYVTGGDLKLPKQPHVALLGARFELDKASGRYRVKSIMPGENDEDRYRSPLTEVGVNVHEGDYILAINGQELTAHDNPYHLLQTAPGQPVELRVNSKPTDAGARTVLVKPLDSEKVLKYYGWVEHNRRYVEEKTGGKVGYVYVPDMGGDGIREFIKWFYPQLRKQGLIVDVRDNGGGNVSNMIIERLSRKLLGLNYDRNASGVGTYPPQVFNGPMAALINETSASDGDIFSYMFKQAKLGPTIGKRTWGGVVGINDYGPVLDGGQVEVPEFVAIADLNGNYHVEGEGVSPDIDVENDVFSTIHGKDPQLDRAIAEVMKSIEANRPGSRRTRPIRSRRRPTCVRKRRNRVAQMCAGTARIAVFGEGKYAEARRGHSLAQRLDIFADALHRSVDAVADPAEQFATVALDRARAQDRVIETTEPQSDDEDDRQPQRFRHIRLRQRNRQRRAPSADAFDDDAIGRFGELREGALDRRERNRDAFFLRGDVRGDRLAQRERIDRFVRRRAVAVIEQRFGIVVAQTARRYHAAAGDRLHADGAQTRGVQRGQQARTRECLADAGSVPVT